MWIIPKTFPLYSAFAQAMVASKEDLSLPGLDIEQSLMWRSKPSLLKTWQRRWKTVCWMPRLCGRILKPSQRKSFETKLTLLLEAIHASPLVRQAKEKAKMTPGTCGHTSATTLEQLDLLDASLKTSKATYRLDSPQLSATWKKMVTQQRGEYSARRKLAHRIEGKEYLSWPTPASRDWKDSMNKVPPSVGKTRGHSLGQRVADVEVQAQTWPTPSARDHKGGSGTIVEEDGKFYRVSDTTQTRFGARLDAVVEYLEKWPTPTVQDSDKATKKMRDNHQNNLTAVVFNPQLPTPTSRDYKGGYKEESLTRTDGKSRRFDALPNAAIGGLGTDIIKGHLNPDWVEQLMGVPPGWTALDGTSNEWQYGWHDGSWEAGLRRVVESCDDRVDRIRLLGNGVVPATAAKAWQILNNYETGAP